MKGWLNKVSLSGVYYRKGKDISDKSYWFGLLQQSDQRTKWFSLVAHDSRTIEKLHEIEKNGKQVILLIDGMITYERKRKINRTIVMDFEIIKELPYDLLENERELIGTHDGKEND